LQKLIRIKLLISHFGTLPQIKKEVAMPLDSILVSAAVVAVFAIFSVVLAWSDFRSGSMSRQPAGPARKRRSF